MPLPLEHIRVIDISQGWAGPLAAGILGDMGAQVFKIESVQHPDWWRGFAGGRLAAGEMIWERSALFNGIARNKLGVTLNLADPQGVELLLRLLKIGDVLIENFTPRVIEGWGLRYERLRQVNPQLVMISMPGFGLNGPWRDYPALGTTTDSMSGVAALCGYEGGSPRLQTVSWDPIVGLHGAVAVLMALRHRSLSGQGQFIELAHIEAGTSLIAQAVMDYSMNRRVWPRRGNRDWSMAPHGCYRCKGDDSWLVIAVRSDEEWASLCRVIGRAELAADPRFATVTGRLANHAALDAIIEAWTGRHDHQEAMEVLQAAGVPAGAVLSAPELLADANLNARGFFETVDRPFVGSHPYPGVTIRMSRTPAHIREPAPTLGQHNRLVIQETLGLTEAEMRRLAEDKVIGSEPLAPR